MGRGAGGKGSEIVLGFSGGGVFGEHDGKFGMIWLLLSSSRGKQQRKGESK